MSVTKIKLRLDPSLAASVGEMAREHGLSFEYCLTLVVAAGVAFLTRNPDLMAETAAIAKADGGEA